ncbi:hypothetical protein DFR29_105150 [Tahibacter aquaticus]|uniref:J domain-containing protein n=2 Tax=Tahibacter aquaticus TaxID=520092 RepID=A0A4R6Z0C5_9GAMM|nr:hypothetical protein DFR29_105150 [Tahibacter aquaticus]
MPADYLADYRLLGLQPGCDLPTLEKTWRRRLAELHPDRAGPAGADALHSANVAFRRLRAFERQHGRLPLTSAVVDAGGPPAPRSSATRQRRAGALALACLGVIVAAFGILYINIKRTESPAAEAPLPAVAATALPAPAPAPAPAAAGKAIAAKPASTRSTAIKPATSRPARQLKLGDSRDNVAALLGAPPLRNRDRWDYGPSHVRFARGRVVDWYSSPRQPLPVTGERPATR